jgi:hypothetical protein
VPPEIPAGFATLTFAPAGAKPPPPIPQNSAADADAPFLRLFGCHKDIPGASVDDFLNRCREDKEHELSVEKRQIEGRDRYAELSP